MTDSTYKISILRDGHIRGYDVITYELLEKEIWDTVSVISHLKLL